MTGPMNVPVAVAPPAQRFDNALVAIALLVFAVAYAQFFGSALSSGLRLLAGDAGDASLIAFLHEHVFRSMLGQASLLNPQFFFPTRGVLGYTDAFLLNQIFYAPFRLAGIESLLAVQLTFMLLALVGSAFFVALLHRFFGVRLWLAVVAAAIFAFAHNLYLKSIHPQHFAIYYLPVVGYLLFASLFAARSAPAIAACALAGGLLLGLTFLTGYYVGWFFLFFLMFAAPVFVAMRWTPIAGFVQANLRHVLLALGAATIGFAAGALAVILVYLPAIKALQWMTLQNFLMSAATFRDLINVSDTNLIWGSLLRQSGIIPLHRLRHTEVHLAVTPLLVAASVAGTYLSARVARVTEYDRLAAAIGVSILFGFAMVYALTISIRGEWSPFFLVQKIVPGAVGIRVGFRSQVISGMFITVAFALVAEAYLRRSAASPSRSGVLARSLIVLAVGGVLVAEQVNLLSVSGLDRTREEALLAGVPPPPAQCRAFAYYNDGSRSLQAVHVDAMRISQKFGLPTVNGYSGGVPTGWDLSGVWDPAYLDHVKKWLRDNGFAGPLCYYVEPTKTWSFVDLAG
jgi:hypothetical protein